MYVFPCCACSTDAVWFDQQMFAVFSFLFSLHICLLGLGMMDESFPELGQSPADCGEWIHPVSPWLALVLQACLNTRHRYIAPSVSCIQESRCMQEWAIVSVDSGMRFVCMLQTLWKREPARTWENQRVKTMICSHSLTLDLLHEV